MANFPLLENVIRRLAVSRDASKEDVKAFARLGIERAVHFKQGGTEAWVSLRGAADKPGETGESVVYDEKRWRKRPESKI